MNEKKLVEDLCLWYQKYGRDLPWRHSQDPYQIWISEIMLQQTQVETVIPYYQRFIQQFKTVKDLDEASEDAVFKCYQGLGYYRRAKHMKEAAHQIMTEHHGIFPTTYDDIHQLKGIGDYTASAIASIAFQLPYGVVDGNVLRILSRIYMIKENIATTQVHQSIQKKVNQLVQTANPSIFNQAMMDLGATICKPRHPLCHLCPVQQHCLAYATCQQDVLPISIKKKNYITGILSYQDRYVLIKQETGLLAHLYGFIQFDDESPYRYMEHLEETYHIDSSLKAYIQDIKHVFTHRIWKMHVYHFILHQKPDLPLYTLEEIAQLPISSAHLKVWQSFLKTQ